MSNAIDEAALFRLIQKSHADGGCLIWDGTKCSGYGAIHFRGTLQRTHRVAYQILVGPIPDGLELDHLCRRRGCWRVGHLEPVTRAENQRRRGMAVLRCPRDHPYDALNTYISPSGQGRKCKACNRERQRDLVQRKRAARDVAA